MSQIWNDFGFRHGLIIWISNVELLILHIGFLDSLGASFLVDQNVRAEERKKGNLMTFCISFFVIF